MKKELQQVKETLEKAFESVDPQNLDQSIQELQSLREQYGDRGTMLEDTIRSLTQAKSAIPQLENAGDVSSSAAFGEAFNALQQAIKSYRESDNDPV